MAAGGILLEAQQRGPRPVLDVVGQQVERLRRARPRRTRGSPPAPARSGPRGSRGAGPAGCRARAGARRRCRAPRAAARAASSTSPGAATAGGSGRRAPARRAPPRARRRAAGQQPLVADRPDRGHGSMVPHDRAPYLGPRRGARARRAGPAAPLRPHRHPVGRATRRSPSTPGQLELARLLVAELLEIGLDDAAIDDLGFVTATLPGTVEGGTVIGLLAHVDTSPDAPGAGRRAARPRGLRRRRDRPPAQRHPARPGADAGARRQASATTS